MMVRDRAAVMPMPFSRISNLKLCKPDPANRQILTKSRLKYPDRYLEFCLARPSSTIRTKSYSFTIVRGPGPTLTVSDNILGLSA